MPTKLLRRPLMPFEYLLSGGGSSEQAFEFKTGPWYPFTVDDHPILPKSYPLFIEEIDEMSKNNTDVQGFILV